MDYKIAKNSLPLYLGLVGKVSTRFGCRVKDAYIGFEDRILNSHMYWFAKRVEQFQELPSDAGRYTICLALEDGTSISARNLVEQDGVEELLSAASELAYMSESKVDKTGVSYLIYS